MIKINFCQTDYICYSKCNRNRFSGKNWFEESPPWIFGIESAIETNLQGLN